MTPLSKVIPIRLQVQSHGGGHSHARVRRRQRSRSLRLHHVKRHGKQSVNTREASRLNDCELQLSTCGSLYSGGGFGRPRSRVERQMTTWREEKDTSEKMRNSLTVTHGLSYLLHCSWHRIPGAPVCWGNSTDSFISSEMHLKPL